jgi:hypothetical protein
MVCECTPEYPKETAQVTFDQGSMALNNRQAKVNRLNIEMLIAI